MSERIDVKAMLFAINKHKDQLDDDGKNMFLTHIIPVVKILTHVTEEHDILAAAYLHDTLEDTNTTYEELLSEFGARIANMVMEVTHEGKADNKGFYFPRLQTKEGIMIKFADRLSNISRMESWSPKRQEQHLKKSRFWNYE
jgi:(p)ppGpp synthase/HD superfamily hydrolase